MMDTQATSRKCPASSPLNTEARQPTTSIGSISLSRVLCSAMLCASRSAPTVLGTYSPPPAMRSCFTQTDYVGEVLGGHNHKRKCCIPSVDPPALCTKPKVAKGRLICGALQYIFLHSTTQVLASSSGPYNMRRGQALLKLSPCILLTKKPCLLPERAPTKQRLCVLSITRLHAWT